MIAPLRTRPTVVATAVATVVALTPLTTASATDSAGESAAQPPPQSERQRTFAAAAAEYGVPEAVVLAVSYLESRWDANAGQPSRSAGYGPMHLTDIDAVTAAPHHDEGDARGDESRPMAVEEAAQPAAEPADGTSRESLRTLDLAAALTGLDPDELRDDPEANIRGGAAVLAHYQEKLGHSGDDPGDWYAAVARYSGASDTATAGQFADEVYATMRTGAARTTDDGQRVSLPPTAVTPQRAQLGDLGMRTADGGHTECPDDLACEWIPAPYEQYGDDSWDYGNHDLANRPDDLDVDYIVIHDTEVSYERTLELVQNPRYVSWQYTLRSRDGHVAQHVKHKDVAWQAGNWYVNTHSIGLEHEGYAAKGTWYTEAMYRSSAKLVRYLTEKYDIPIDRHHIIGHDNVPAITPNRVPAMHWDPGPYWDWAHYFELLGKPFRNQGTADTGVVTIRPDYATNKPAFTGCEKRGEPCPERGSTSVILRSAPRDDAPLLNDIGLRPDGSPNTMHISDIGSRVDTGQQFAVAERRGDWTAVWYLGQKGWLHTSDVVWAAGPVVTPKPGRESIPVYGRAYPEASAYPDHIRPRSVVPLQYEMHAGERYVAGAMPSTDYYWAVTYDPSGHTVVRGEDRYIQVQFGHRAMFVRAADVNVIGSPAR